jgi:hypothetical protein
MEAFPQNSGGIGKTAPLGGGFLSNIQKTGGFWRDSTLFEVQQDHRIFGLALASAEEKRAEATHEEACND